MSKKTAQYPYGWAGGQETTDYQIPLAMSTTLTNATLALEFFGGSQLSTVKLDLAGVTQVRLTGLITTASASADSPRVLLRYLTAFSATAADYLTLGVSEVSFSLFTGQTFGDTGWIEMVTGAKTNDIYLTLLDVGGDGAIDPVVGPVTVHFR